MREKNLYNFPKKEYLYHLKKFVVFWKISNFFVMKRVSFSLDEPNVTIMIIFRKI